MRYYVGVVLSPTSSGTDFRRIVRNSSTNEAIATFMRSEDLSRAYAAYAYPMKRRHYGPSSADWRSNIRCSVTGKVSMSVGMPPLKSVEGQPDVYRASGC